MFLVPGKQWSVEVRVYIDVNPQFTSKLDAVVTFHIEQLLNITQNITFVPHQLVYMLTYAIAKVGLLHYIVKAINYGEPHE